MNKNKKTTWQHLWTLCVCIPSVWTLVNCTVCENAKHLEFVDKCPRNKYEFTIAAKRKQSEYVPDDCPERNTHPLVYHCVIHAKLLTPVEVCARVWISQGYCVEYDPNRNEVVSDYEKNCTSFKSKPCPQFFNSPDNFKYPGCYEKNLVPGVNPLRNTTGGDSNCSVSTTVIILCVVILTVQLVGIGIVITLYLRAQRKRTRTGLINAPVEETEMNRI